MNFERNSIDVTFADNATQSGVINLGTAVPCGLIVPAGWLTADLTFKGSFDGVNFFDIQWENGGAAEDLIVAGVAASKLVVLDPAKFLPSIQLKIVSSVSQTGGPLTLSLLTRFFQ